MGFGLTDPAGCLCCIFFICQWSPIFGGVSCLCGSVKTWTIEPSAAGRAPTLGPCYETLGATSPNQVWRFSMSPQADEYDSSPFL